MLAQYIAVPSAAQYAKKAINKKGTPFIFKAPVKPTLFWGISASPAEDSDRFRFAFHTGNVTKLNERNDPISVVPGRVCQCEAHDKGADNRTHSPHAVQPAHMSRRVMNRDIVVERRVNRPRAQTVGNRKDNEHPKF